jgi:hypothetical protein
MGFAWLENNTKLNGPSKAQYMELDQINLSIQMFANFYVFVFVNSQYFIMLIDDYSRKTNLFHEG